MRSSKFIQIRKERSVEQRLASIWLDACSELEIPCILVYESNWNAYISVNLKFVPEALAENLDQEKIQHQLAIIQQKYTSNTTGYCKHNNSYHTFDAIPKAHAKSAAAEIFDTIMQCKLESAAPLLLEHQLTA